MRELLVATRNERKMPEIRYALKDVPFSIVDINEVSALEGFEPEEHGATIKKNAIIKAKEYGTHAGMLTLADDSGLEVDALDGGPGVLSARYAEGTDKDRYQKLLNEMEHVPDGKREAQFRCVIAIYDPEKNKTKICEGILRGRIVREPSGAMGFGYDPIFFNQEAGKMHSEETVKDRNTTSHRGKALAKARSILLGEFH